MRLCVSLGLVALLAVSCTASYGEDMHQWRRQDTHHKERSFHGQQFPVHQQHQPQYHQQQFHQKQYPDFHGEYSSSVHQQGHQQVYQQGHQQVFQQGHQQVFQQSPQHHSYKKTSKSPKVADKDFLTRQKYILQLLIQINQYTVYPELAEFGKKYDIFASADRYSNQHAYQNFLSYYKQGFLPRGEIFNLYNDFYLEQAVALFDLFYFAKDFETFFYTACWARDYFNEGQFVYALYVAVLHREDTYGFVLPPLYEVYPYFYFYGNDINEFSKARQLGYKEFYYYTNFSGYYYGDYYGNYYGNPEQILSYFTEDIGLNAYHAYSHLYNPFWFSADKYNFNFQARGEYFYYYYQQILNFYSLNRMANFLPEMEYFDWDKPIPYGYYPQLQYHNGKYFSARPDNYHLESIRSYSLQDIQFVEYRIREAIDSGYVYSKDGTRVPIFNYLKGINLLGNIVEANGDSVNSRYYGSYQSMLRSLFSLIVDPGYNHGVAPGVLANFETALRDPAFYYFYKYITRFFRDYAYYQPAYKYDDLFYSGVSIKNVEVDKLYTYFDYFNVDMSNAVYLNTPEDKNIKYYAKSLRLNHEPFSYKLYVQSDKNTTALVRVFFGPSYEAFYSTLYGFYAGGNEFYYQGGFPYQESDPTYFYKYINFDKLKEYFVEWDRFPVNLVPGDNQIVRSSKQFTTTVGDYPSFRQIYQQVQSALEGSSQFYIYDYDQQCGFPDRLVLPLGSKAGTPYSFYAYITPYSESQQNNYEGFQYSCSGAYQYYDNKPLGYPFDRKIPDFSQFYTPNMYFKDVFVYQKNYKQGKQGPNYTV